MIEQNICVNDLGSMNVPDDLAGLVKNILTANEANHYSMLIPTIGVAILVKRIVALEQQVKEKDLDLNENYQLRERLAFLLIETANALHNGPKENGLWSWHDLPELSKNAINKIKELEGACEHTL